MSEAQQELEVLKKEALREHYDPEVGFTHIAEYCMIAPDEETLFDSNNDIVGNGS